MADCSCGKMSGTRRNFVFVIFAVVLFNLCLVNGKSIPKKGEEEQRYILSKDPTCARDVENHCSKVPRKDNNFAVFVCMQEALYRDDDDISEECHQTMWHYKFNLTSDMKFDEAATQICETSIPKVKECANPKLRDTKGFLMNCMVENRHEVEDTKCKGFLNKMAAIIFSDYRLIKGFYDDCHKDITTMKCAIITRPDDDEATESHEQSEVVSCLESRFEEIKNEKCQQAVLKVSELQSDDYHMDRPLFYACQNAREIFCKTVQSGEGRIYECLLKHSQEESMDHACAIKLLARSKMMQKDIKINYPLWKACEADYKKYDCEKERKEIKNPSEHGEGSLLLMCLTKHQAEGSPIEPDCANEMRSFAMLIFEQYQVSPLVVGKCDKEIHEHCKTLIGKEKDDGGMMDCLMGLAAKENSGMSEQCFTAITEVLKETGAGDNYKVDRGLEVACQSTIAQLCEGKQDSMILSCLMENTHNPKMDPSCREQVFHLQFFLARDFRLDSALYRDCKDDAKTICHATDWGNEKESTMPDNFVISCLYRNAILHDNPAHKVSDVCASHVKRVMHQRATDIRLMPEIEKPCMADLGKFCTDRHEEGEEIDCLQEHLEELQNKCQEAIKTFTKMEAKDFDLDKHLVDKCGAMVTKFCPNELQDKDGEQILPCLISHKNDIEMNAECTTALEHWQLIEMKDIEFSPRLKDACMDDAMKLCKDAKSKYQAVRCLSQKMVEDHTKVSSQCKLQIRKELTIQSENIKLNPEMFHACQDDIKEHCHGIPPGGAQIEECLRRNFPKLKSAACKKALFKQEEMESKDNGMDYRLMQICKPMIKKYCQPLVSTGDTTAIMECLRSFTHDTDMSKECKAIVFERQKEQAESFALDPELSSFCDSDVKRHCSREMKEAQKSYDQGHTDEGLVFGCLVDVLIGKKNRLQPSCEQYVRRREHEAALELELNPQFLEHCRDEVFRLCGKTPPEEVIDCMKMNIPKIKGTQCVEEVRKLIAEGIEDVHVDPFLEETCARDINRYCKDLPKKSGNVVYCLIDVHKAKNLHLDPDCDNFIAKRIQLYKDANVNFDSVSSVMVAIAESPHRNYIYMTIMIFLAVLFLGGTLFGRVTKRALAEQKNR
ncbi:Golgi apparatus protein 1-like isoform X5 [Clytia hemisphaerica]|uniref:Golgi apparatus protein 1-like isoform X5 n=1 Tax=Clytia hemisphaerica TaxID=252671 RepID=UPI0034D61010